MWFSGIAGDADTEALEEWLRRGGPGRHDVPEELAEMLIDRAVED